MLNKFEIESVNLKSFDSSVKQNMGQLLTVQCSSPKRNSKKTGFTQYRTIRIQKNDNFGKSSKFLGIPAGNFRDRRFPGFPVALIHSRRFCD